MLVEGYQVKKKNIYKAILLMLESKVTVMSQGLKLFTTKIKKWEGWTKMMQ